MQFEKGLVHLVKSDPSVLSWVIQDLPNIQLVWFPNQEELINSVECDSFEPCSYLIIGAKPSLIPKGLIPNQDNYYFILLSSFGEQINKEAEKAYKSLSGGCFKQVDLTKTKYVIKDDEKISQLITHRNLSDSEVVQLLTDLPNPFRLYWQLQQEDIFDYETCSLEKEAMPLITSLLTNAGINKWATLTRRHVYALFMCSEISNSPMYLILAGNPKSNKQYGLCPSLWVYLNMFIETLLLTYEHNPQYILMLFATWVRLASTTWATVKHPGFSSKTYPNGRVYYSFDPSIEAHNAFNRLVR